MHDAGMWTDLPLPGHFFFQGNSRLAVYEIVRTFNLFHVFLEFPPSTICMNTIFPSDHFHVYWFMSMYTKWIFPLLEGQKSAFGSRGVGGIMNDFTTHTRDHGLTARLDTFFFSYSIFLYMSFVMNISHFAMRLGSPREYWGLLKPFQEA